MTDEMAAKLRNLLVPIRELMDECAAERCGDATMRDDANAAFVEILELADIDGVSL